MCASKTTGYQGFRSFSIQQCPTLKPGDSYEARATKFSKMAPHILAPASFNQVGRDAYHSIAAHAMEQVQPTDYHVPDKRGVSASDKLPEHKRFLAVSTYQHDFTLHEKEITSLLQTPIQLYEEAFRYQTAGSEDQQIALQHVPNILHQALGIAAIPRIVDTFVSFLDHRGNQRDRISWELFHQAVEHVNGIFARPPSPKTRCGHSGLSKIQINKLIPATTPLSSNQIDFGRYGDIPVERPYVRKRGMATTTGDLNHGTTKDTHQLPGYAGFLPLTKHNPEAVQHADAEQARLRGSDLRLYHSDNIPGFTGHKPVDCINYRGETRSGSDPKTTSGAVYHPHL